jgi:tRNA A-37 threonylcarbamoyl transferase component Bud32
MKHDFSAPSCLLRVKPLGGRLPEGTPVELNLARGGLIKNERVTLIFRDVPVDGRQTVVKIYRRGRLVRLHGLATYFRVQREFAGLSVTQRLGIPCSIPVFWAHGHFGPYGWGEMLVTEWVARSQSLRDLLGTRPELGSPLDLSPMFADLAKMHAAGVQHGMLRTKNILVKDYPESPVFVFIDFPRFHHFPRDIRGTRMARHDVMSLWEGLLPHFPEDMMHVWLSAYGIREREQMDLLARLKRFRSTPFLRKVLAWEFDVRHVAARLLTPPPPNRPEDWSLLNISPFRKPHFRRARSSSAIVREGDHTCQTGVDRATVITGSFNFTKAAQERREHADP